MAVRGRARYGIERTRCRPVLGIACQMSGWELEAPGWVRLIERELRVGGRDVGTRRFLFLCALTSFLLLIGLLVLGAVAGRRVNGALYFNAMALPLMVYSAGCGAFLTADAISSERRDRTLPQLFLSNLWAGEIVVGKLVSSSLRAFFGLIACLPAFGISLLLGGVTGGEFWRTSLTLIVSLVFSVAFGVWVSAGLRESQNNLMRTALGLIAMSGLPPLLELLGPHFRLFFPEALQWVSPFFAFRSGLEPYFPGNAWGVGVAPYWASLATLLVLALGFSGAASWTLRRNWRRAEPSVALKTKSRPARRTGTGGVPVRPPLFYDEAAPLAALVRSRLAFAKWERVGIRILWVVFAVALAINTYTGVSGMPLGCMVAFGSSFLMGLLVKWRWVTVNATGAAQDVRSGFLQTIAATPHPVDQLWRERLRAARERFAPALWATMATNLVLIVVFTVFRGPLSVGGDDLLVFYGFFFGGVLRFLVDVWALGPLGICLGYQGARPGVAACMGEDG